MKKGTTKMTGKARRRLYMAIGLLAAFCLWTALVITVDKAPIGPQGTSVGFATLNGAVHQLTGVHMELYTVTDWLSILPLGLASGFGVLGLIQWIKRKRLTLVDRDLLLLGGFYVAVFLAYLLFEVWVVNCRPVLIEGRLEASYPSSTTMLVTCIMPTAMMQLGRRVSSPAIRAILLGAMAVFTVFMVVGRLWSGVHWISDIIGGLLLSGGLVLLYHTLEQRT